MKNMIIGIFVAILVLAFSQPLIEMANVLKEKVALGAAILNSCRAARNNALTSTDYYAGDQNMGDLNAYIDENEFRRFFTEAFEQTLNLTATYSSGNEIRFESNDGRWSPMTVWVNLEYDDTDVFDFDFSGRGMSRAIIDVETPYVFRTSLLRAAVGASGNVYNITETRQFIVQIIN